MNINILKLIPGFIFMGMALGFSGQSWSQAVSVGLAAGNVSAEAEGFSSADMAVIFLSYHRENNYNFELSQYWFDEMAAKKGNGGELRVKGSSMSVNRVLPLSALKLRLGMGLMVWRADAYISRRIIGEDSGTSMLFNIEVAKALGAEDSFEIFFNYKHVKDVTGSALGLSLLGARLWF